VLLFRKGALFAGSLQGENATKKTSEVFPAHVVITRTYGPRIREDATDCFIGLINRRPDWLTVF